MAVPVPPRLVLVQTSTFHYLMRRVSLVWSRYSVHVYAYRTVTYTFTLCFEKEAMYCTKLHHRWVCPSPPSLPTSGVQWCRKLHGVLHGRVCRCTISWPCPSPLRRRWGGNSGGWGDCNRRSRSAHTGDGSRAKGSLPSTISHPTPPLHLCPAAASLPSPRPSHSPCAYG